MPSSFIIINNENKMLMIDHDSSPYIGGGGKRVEEISNLSTDHLYQLSEIDWISLHFSLE